ncbi:hypothetical protein IM40_03415 [Candidatus Paracaedimonas acanthamoebae]|nr:hypothetical protein IM40_03415 [Candidatus Paracaedimonas acanthamoebae]
MVTLNSLICLKSVEHLKTLLANTYLLALKTQNCHWNVTGSNFSMLHELFGNQYEILSDAIDEIAERIRMLGERAPATFHEFLKLATLAENDDMKTAEVMITALLNDNEKLIEQLRQVLQDLNLNNDKDLVDFIPDEGTIDFLVGRLREHEKASWMLRSHLVF